MLGLLDRATTSGTVHLLVAGFALIGLGLAGVGGSVAVVALLLVAAVVLSAVRQRVPSLGRIAGRRIRPFVVDAWVAPAVAATATVLELGATSAEMQALGGLLGLAGMVNYFLRPVYYLAYSLAESVLGRDRPNGG